MLGLRRPLREIFLNSHRTRINRAGARLFKNSTSVALGRLASLLADCIICPPVPSQPHLEPQALAFSPPLWLWAVLPLAQSAPSFWPPHVLGLSPASGLPAVHRFRGPILAPESRSKVAQAKSRLKWEYPRILPGAADLGHPPPLPEATRRGMGSICMCVMDREIQAGTAKGRPYPWDEQKEIVTSVSHVMETPNSKSSFPRWD